MEIVSGRSALLSNWEVYHLLQESAKTGDSHSEKVGDPENLQRIRDQSLRYLRLTALPTLRQSEDGLKGLLNELRDVDLTKSEKLMISNLAPTSNVELYAIVEELEDRFPDRIDGILTAVQSSLSDLPMEVNEDSVADLNTAHDHEEGSKGIVDADADAIGDDEWTNGMDEQPFVDSGLYGDVVEGDLENDMDED